MRVALGTIDISDETRRAIRADSGDKGLATRNEVKEFLLDKITDEVIPGLRQESAVE